MTALAEYPTLTDDQLTGDQQGRLAADTIRSQANEDDEVDEETDEAQYDEPLDDDGDPTGEHDHHQDDNYALGGHVTRSGS